MTIKYYNKDCKSMTCCSGMRARLEEAMKQAGVTATLAMFDGIAKAQEHGIPEVPALVINDELILSGYIPSDKELVKAIKEAAK